MSETQASQNHTNSTEENASMSDHARDTAQKVASGAMDIGHDAAHHYVGEPARDLFSLAKSYAKDNPDVAACWAFGLGVIIGWKLKP